MYAKSQLNQRLHDCCYLLVAFGFFWAQVAQATVWTEQDFLTQRFAPVFVVSQNSFKNFLLQENDKQQVLQSFCKDLQKRFNEIGWREDPCGKVPWQVSLKSAHGLPLIYAVFGEGTETTLLLSGVHPDELTPIPIAFRFAANVAAKPDLYKNTGARVVIAPLVNPDGFFIKAPKRVNYNGVDLNRNFPTADWYTKAKPWWAERRGKDERHFPGYFPNSEIETLFQIHLLDKFKPDKVISIHAPLGFLDYDGPGDQKPRALTNSEQKAKRLVQTIAESSKNYRIVDYSFYPGSLGNYAGNERGIPTVTLELETTNPKKLDEYWNQFSPGLEQSIKYPFKNERATSSPSAHGHQVPSTFLGFYLKDLVIFQDLL